MKNITIKFIFAVMLTGSFFIGAANAENMTPSVSGEKEMPHHKGMMKERDTDGDGAISKAEYMVGAEERFAKMDKNSDGKITQDEMEAMRSEIKERRAEWKTKMKEKASENKNSSETKE